VFGCLRRFVSLILLAVVGIGAYATRDLWLPKVRAALGDAGQRAPAGANDSSARAAADTGWSALSFATADRGRKALTRLTTGKGTAFVTMGASEFAGAMLDSLSTQLPASADSLQVRAAGSEFLVRASVKLGDLGGRAVLGPLASMVGDRERLTLGGTLEPTSVPGVAQFRLTRVQVGDFAVPSPVVPRLMRAFKRGGTGTPGVEVSALPVRLPAGVGDIRVAQGKITLYRAAP
jgi:hypothetical protein